MVTFLQDLHDQIRAIDAMCYLGYAFALPLEFTFNLYYILSLVCYFLLFSTKPGNNQHNPFISSIRQTISGSFCATLVEFGVACRQNVSNQILNPGVRALDMNYFVLYLSVRHVASHVHSFALVMITTYVACI